MCYLLEAEESRLTRLSGSVNVEVRELSKKEGSEGAVAAVARAGTGGAFDAVFGTAPLDDLPSSSTSRTNLWSTGWLR